MIMQKEALLKLVEHQPIGRSTLSSSNVGSTRRDVVGTMLHECGVSDQELCEFDVAHLGRSEYYDELWSRYGAVLSEEYGLDSVAELRRIVYINDVYGRMGLIRLAYGDTTLPE